MRSRTLREGSVGLLILLGLGVFAGVILWLRGIQPGNRSYKVTFEFPNVSGINDGTPVRYRGLTVGRITAIRPGSNGVEVEALISPADLVIPKNVVVQANQSGLLGDASIDIVPKGALSETITTKPLDRNCNQQEIICDNARVAGVTGVNINDTLTAMFELASLYSDPKFFRSVDTLLRNTSVAMGEFTVLGREATLLTKQARQELSTFSDTARSIQQTSGKLGLTADQANNLLATNRQTLVTTLTYLNDSTRLLKQTLLSLNTAVDRTTKGEMLQNLEALSANINQASANLRDLSQALNSPANLTILQQTLDSARATFQNTQKITADLDELTGDPQLRKNLRNLINGLSGLVSSSQQLQQQAQLAQVLVPLAESANRPAADLKAQAATRAEKAAILVPARPVDGNTPAAVK